jgi:DegV family protein with EDD domain
MSVVVVTDSVSNIPSNIAEDFGIQLVPFYVLIGDKTYVDTAPLVREKVYRAMREGKEVGTSHPTVVDYVKVFGKLREEGKEILYMTVSKNWTLSLDIATEAARRIGEKGIELLDTKTALGHLGMVAIEVAKLAKEGVSLREACNYAKDLVKRGGLYFVLDTLKFLAKSGRIGRVQSILGGALRLKPVLTVVNGVADVASKTFSEKQALNWIMRNLEVERAKNKGRRMLVSIEVGDRRDWGNVLFQVVSARFSDTRVFEFEMSPVVSCHTGPGIWGISFLFP